MIFDFFSKKTLIQWAPILEKIPYFKSPSDDKSEFIDLAPTDKADEDEIYTRALNWAIKNQNVLNIALTGPYGSGKSSIIKTFLTKYKKPSLLISLAAFLPEGENNVQKLSKQEIERSILQQMLYGADANKLPLSRFKRIQSPSRFSLLISLYIMSGLVNLWFLIKKLPIIVNGNFFLPLDFLNAIQYISIIFGFIFLWSVLHHVYIKSFGVSLKSISLKDIEITPDAIDKESILNRHLDEIIYFFQSTKYELVIIEDLDRFNDPDIFVTLREINSLINANAGVKRTVKFLYALRDNMFINTDRTKFFEFIIPVIPIINSSNSIDKLLEQGERVSLDKRLKGQFLREVSRYLNDLRLIRNIYNEYAVYSANLETDGDAVLDANKLLAVLIYKNVLPSDFEELHQGKGQFANILNLHDEFISRTEAEYKSQISKLEEQLNVAERQTPNDLSELRKIYAMALIEKTIQNCFYIRLNSSPFISLQQISNHPEFERIIEASDIDCFSQNQQYLQNLTITGFQNEVNSQKNYQQRKKEIENKSAEFKSSSSKNMREISAKISKLRLAKFNEIIQENSKRLPNLFVGFGENKELVRYLVLEGFLDDTYHQYTSLFHSGRLSRNDNKFLIQIRSFNNPEPDFQIDNPKEVIAEMRDEDFSQNYALNKALVDCMFSNSSSYARLIAKFIEFITSSFDQCESFFSTYYESGKCVSEFLMALIDKSPNFVTIALENSKNIVHVGRMIAHLPEEYLASLTKKNAYLSEFVSEKLTEILALGIAFDATRLILFKLQIKDLSSFKATPEIARLLVDEGQYELTIENVEFVLLSVLGGGDVFDLNSRHYSTVLRSQNTVLIDKIERDFSRYVKTILLELKHNSKEDVSAILKVISHDEIEDEYLNTFLEMQSAILPSLDMIPARFHSKLFELKKIEVSWGNCLAYINSEDFKSEVFTAYLQEKNTLDVLSKVEIGDDDKNRPLWISLIRNYNLNNDAYRLYVRVIPRVYHNFPNGVTIEKSKILIEEEEIVFLPDSFKFLEEHIELQVLFITKNINLYLDKPDQFSIDDEFRERLLKAEIDDKQKISIIEAMDLSLLVGLPDRAKAIGEIIDRAGADVSSVSAEAAQAIIINSKPITTQISLFNRYQKLLSDDQVRQIIQTLPRPFCEIKTGYGAPTLDKTEENLEFAKWLEKRHFISSSKLLEYKYLDDKIKINLFRK